MQQGRPCHTKSHIVQLWGRQQGRQWIRVGCVVNPTSNMTPANPDLRQITLPANYNEVTRFTLQSGNTEYLPRLPRNLRTLHVTNNQLRELPELPDGLVDINLNHNNLTSLPTLTQNLTHLEVKHNSLVSLPDSISPNLETLHVTHNNLTELPDLDHSDLESLGAGFNQLTSLPNLPESLRRLGCSNNNIIEIKDLPERLRVLNCSNNPLKVLKIDNCIMLTTIIATNCGLRELPIINYSPPGNNNDNNDGGGHGTTYIFDNNPLDDEFQDIYTQFRQTGDGRAFRNAILAEHQRRAATRKATLGALIQTLKGPGTIKDATTGAEMSQLQTLGANHGPLNLIATFITGKPGTMESQRLALLENQERLGSVPEGTAQQAREAIANVASGVDDLSGVGLLTDEQKKRLKERAKLYVKKENIELSRARNEMASDNNNDNDNDNASNSSSSSSSSSNRNNNDNENENRFVGVVVNEVNNENNGEAVRVALQEEIAAVRQEQEDLRAQRARLLGIGVNELNELNALNREADLEEVILEQENNENEENNQNQETNNAARARIENFIQQLLGGEPGRRLTEEELNNVMAQITQGDPAHDDLWIRLRDIQRAHPVQGAQLVPRLVLRMAQQGRPRLREEQRQRMAEGRRLAAERMRGRQGGKRITPRQHKSSKRTTRKH